MLREDGERCATILPAADLRGIREAVPAAGQQRRDALMIHRARTCCRRMLLWNSPGTEFLLAIGHAYMRMQQLSALLVPLSPVT